jgi:FixJ family two-component response regulator
MPDVNGLDLQSALAQTRFALPVLFLTGHADTASTVQAMRAEDVLEKTSPLQALLEVVSRALARDAQERQERFSRQSLHARFARLTGRENEVLAHVLRGRHMQIAGDLGINERTVKAHRKSIMSKVEVRSVAALAQLSQDAGWPVHPEPLLPSPSI